MWAAIKSDFKEFVAETAEETKAVVTNNSKSAVVSSDDTAGINNNSSDAGTNRSWAGGALNLTANLSNLTSKATHVASNIDVKGFSSMIGGVVAPHPTTTSSQQHQSTSVAAAGDKNASALLAEDEEEELGWDDDDDDDLDVEDVQLDSSDATAAVLPAADGDVDGVDADGKSDSNQDAVTSEQTSPNTNKEDDTNEILTILQNKLSAVENECNELQAELVELRSKVDELQRKSEGQENEEEMEVQALKYYRLLPSLGTKTRVTLPIKTSHVKASVPTSHHHLAVFLR